MLDGIKLKNALISGANNIVKNKDYVNKLNIFPVPDGDTGTNMSMTISAAVKRLEELPDQDLTTGEVIEKFVPGLLRGARGNSGVILSILFRGFSKLFEDSTTLNGVDMVSALEIGVRGAYDAVTKPTEGTMLTVARKAFESGKEASKTNNDITTIWQHVCKGAKEALELTPELLPVLKKAGVVDAGGKGLCLIFEGMLSVFSNDKIVDCEVENITIEDDDVFRNAAAEFDGDITFTYCTECIIRRSRFCKIMPTKLKAKLQKIGDCVVVVDDEEIIKVHVHTENPGKVLQEAIKFGQLITVKIENMKEQHRIAVETKKEKLIKEQKPDLTPKSPEEDFGFVAVAAGNGLCSLFKELGCANVISGGQTMNPSTDTIVEAILATPAKHVYVFPNNKNIIMSAQQAVGLIKDRIVTVVPTKTIPQGISALLSFNGELDPQENLTVMLNCASQVKTGQITFAARDSEFGGLKIKENDIIGLSDGKLVLSEKEPVKAVVRLVKSMVNKDSEFITIIYGQSINLQQAELVKELLSSCLKSQVEINLINGEQPIYHFIVSVE